MKKTITTILAVAMAASIFTGCNNNNSSQPSSSSQEPSVTQSSEESSEQTASSSSESPESSEESKESQTEEADSSASNEEESDAAQQTGSQLSDDLMSLQISIDGVVVALPCEASQLMELGYSLGDKADNILENKYTTGSLMKMENGNYISVSIYNVAGEAKTFKECMVDDLYIKESNSKGQEVILPGGITFGASKEDIIAQYGEPTKENENGNFVYLTYERGDDFANNVKIVLKNNALFEINVLTRGK